MNKKIKGGVNMKKTRTDAEFTALIKRVQGTERLQAAYKQVDSSMRCLQNADHDCHSLLSKEESDALRDAMKALDKASLLLMNGSADYRNDYRDRWSVRRMKKGPGWIDFTNGEGTIMERYSSSEAAEKAIKVFESEESGNDPRDEISYSVVDDRPTKENS